MTPRVHVLTFSGCPHAIAAVELVEQVAQDIGVDIDLRLIHVPDAAAAAERRFLGSPTVRVDGKDVEPGADQRRDFALACRVYDAVGGVSGLPTRQWLEMALRASYGGG